MVSRGPFEEGTVQDGVRPSWPVLSRRFRSFVNEEAMATGATVTLVDAKTKQQATIPLAVLLECSPVFESMFDHPH